MNFKQVLLKTAVLALSWIAGSAAYAQQPFTIRGELGKDKQGIVRLQYYTEEGEVKDSAVVKDGVFILKGAIADPGVVTLVLNPPNYRAMTVEIYKSLDQQNFYLEGAAYLVKGDAGVKTAAITGGQAQKDYAALQALHRPLEEQMHELIEKMEKFKEVMNDTGMQRIQAEAKPLGAKGKEIDSVFIAGHPDSYIAFDLFRKKVRGFIEPSVIEPQFLHFSQRLRHTTEGEKLAVRIAKAKKLDVGQPAIDFTLKDTLGRDVSLSSLKGKYVLLCFWQLNIIGFETMINHLQRVNRLFKDRGLTVLAVSYNLEQSKWMDAIHQNNMSWVNLTDKDGIDKKNKPVSAVAEAYDLNYGNIPQCLLVSPDGKIVARNLWLDNGLPYVIEKAMGSGAASAAGSSGGSMTSAGSKTPAGAAGGQGSDVYVGGEMKNYPTVEWIKGAPVMQFEKDHIYIVELWATWCVPCVAAMPHLNALSQKFGDKISFIGQDVMEDDKTKVAKFVQQKGDGLTYRIAFAGGEGSDFDKKWIKPAGVSGIPQTFVIQNNKLVWQTHPSKLNEAVLQLLVDGKFTVEAAEALSEKE